MKITRAYPTRAFFRPGEAIGIRVQLSAVPPLPLDVHVDVVNLAGIVVRARSTLTERQGTITAPVPTLSGVGYGVHVELQDPRTGRTLDRRSTSLDVQQSWVDAPRYGVFCEFSPGQKYDQSSELLLQRHINVIQFYDWMYRHYQYVPPEDTFTDILGRTLSLSSTKRAIAASHARGMAAIAYGSVYGAEAEYALQRPDELVYDAQGDPLSLGKVFYLQDLRSGPWREHILGEYRRAVQDLQFDGIHADQYGIEDNAFDSKHMPVPWGPAFSGFIEAGQHAVTDAGGDGVIFNFVNNWPIEESAAAPQLCTYIEVWPPHITLKDLHTLIRGAKRLAPERQVILAAYMSCATDAPDKAEASTLLTGATIAASGGFHLLTVEGNGILADAYYPKFVRPGPRFTRRLLDLQDFTVRYGAYLFDRSLRYGSGVHVSDANCWTIHRVGNEFETISLLNTGPGDLWDAVRAKPRIRKDVVVHMPFDGQPERVYLASPAPGADADVVPFDYSKGTLRFTVPSVDVWTLAIIIRRSPTQEIRSTE